MSRSGSTPTKPVPVPQRGRKLSQALQIIVECVAVVSTQFGNFKREWISSETCLLPLLEKSETLPKLAILPTNELFVALDEEEFFSIRFFFIVWNKG